MKRRNVAIPLFDDVEVLDFAGPFEVFSVTDELNDYALFDVFTCADTLDAIIARNGLSVNPHHELSDCPRPDILIVPGGSGTRPVLGKKHVLEWIREVSRKAELVLSVCSGALVLAKTGLLDGLEATTHHQVLDELAALAPKTKVLRDRRYVDNGSVMTSAGIAAGIDMCLYVVEKLLGREYAARTAAYMEYDRVVQTGKPRTYQILEKDLAAGKFSPPQRDYRRGAPPLIRLF